MPGPPHAESEARSPEESAREDRRLDFRPGDPRSAIYAAVLFGKYPGEIRATKPPDQVFRALALIGRALRFEV